MSLSVDIRHRKGDFTLEVSFEARGGVTALFGASGAGKTTVVNAVAGLMQPDRGRIALGERVFFDSEAGIFQPPHLRGMGYVFQEGRLFPHLTVAQNLAYPGRYLAEPPTPAETGAIVSLLGIGALMDRRPGRLSGGETQRVAIGRALLAKPSMLLLDEPLAALDGDRRAEVLPYLARLRDETRLPILYVSHARAEVRALATHVVVLTAGRVTAEGHVGEVLGRGGAGPIITIPVQDQTEADAGQVRLITQLGAILSLSDHLPATGARSVTIVASDVVLTRAPRNDIAAPNVVEVRVGEVLKASPGMMDVRLHAGASEFVARLALSEAARLKIAPGQVLRAIIARFILS